MYILISSLTSMLVLGFLISLGLRIMPKFLSKLLVEAGVNLFRFLNKCINIVCTDTKKKYSNFKEFKKRSKAEKLLKVKKSNEETEVEEDIYEYDNVVNMNRYFKEKYVSIKNDNKVEDSNTK